MANELVKIQPLTMEYIELIKTMAPIAHMSRMFRGVSSPDQAMVIILAGRELGFEPMAAMQNLEMIEGKIALKPQGMMAKIHQSQNFDIKVEDMADGCAVWMRRRDTGFEYRATFTKADAAQAQISKPNGAYDKYPPDMYRARAIARCARVAAPDVLAGLYLTTELRTVGEEIDGMTFDMVEGEVVE